MNKVFVIPNIFKNQAVSVALKVCTYFYENGYEVIVKDEFQPELDSELSSFVKFASAENGMRACDFVVTIGGDGTLLHAAPLAAKLKKPILGINNGKLGFMTDLDASQLELLNPLKNSQFNTEDRILLDVSIVDKDGNERLISVGLNDATITKGFSLGIVDIRISVDGKPTMDFRGDGIIVSTPTGSTGYSLSAGGPIIEPNANCIAVTPICPHALSIKSFVLSSDRVIDIIPQNIKPGKYLSVDGKDYVEIKTDEIVRIRRSKDILTMIRVTNQGFYDRINGKLVKEVL